MTRTSQQTWVRLAALTALSMSFVGCDSSQSSSSHVKVTNGIEIAETDYPSVVFIASQVSEGVASCTATFVNDSQAITAGHCVEGTSSTRPSLYLIEKSASDSESLTPVARALSWYRDANYRFDDGVNPLDVAVINFPANTAPAVSRLAVVDPKVDDKLTIVGYGNNRNFVDDLGQLSGSGAGKKRAGTNLVGNVTEDGMIEFIGTPDESNEGLDQGLYSLSGSGDSGGPLFINGRLAGVTSGGGVGQGPDGQMIFIAQYVSLRSQTSQALLKKALKPGTNF